MFGSVAQLNRASDYGSEGCRFESCRSHKQEKRTLRKVKSSFCLWLIDVTPDLGSVEKYWGVFFSFIVFCIFAL